jgi:hypothetical protein
VCLTGFSAAKPRSTASAQAIESTFRTNRTEVTDSGRPSPRPALPMRRSQRSSTAASSSASLD